MEILDETKDRYETIISQVMFFFFKLAVVFFLDWNTLIVGKLSPWIDADAEIETERRNSEAVSSSTWTISLMCLWMLMLKMVL